MSVDLPFINITFSEEKTQDDSDSEVDEIVKDITKTAMQYVEKVSEKMITTCAIYAYLDLKIHLSLLSVVAKYNSKRKNKSYLGLNMTY